MATQNIHRFDLPPAKRGGMLYRDGRRIREFIENLTRLSRPEQATELFASAMAQFGFDRLIMTGVDPNVGFATQTLQYRGPGGLFEIYDRENLHKIDTLYCKSRRSVLPIEWDRTTYERDRSGTRCTTLFRERHSHGKGCGAPPHFRANRSCVSRGGNAKLGARSRVHAVAIALRRHIIDGE
jgi:hypothetical protein